ncbi:MAG: hypothetical protein F6J97_03740, partial [Leptolyngbya sp. SIO4C1]|nr:hypothetical protein [Leptolyngbya sp. SIO4C1]
DNANVLFEAGMFHALMNDASAVPAAWIPVREKPPPPIPFDFATLRILEVERLQDGTFNHDTFKNELETRLESLLTEEIEAVKE